MRLDRGVADGGFVSMRAGGRSVPRLGFLPTPHGAKPNQGSHLGSNTQPWKGRPRGCLGTILSSHS